MPSQLLTLKIEKPAYGNVFIARHDGKIVMVKGHAMTGETVEVRIEKERKDYITASISKIIEPSTDRIEPKCKYYGICGGCHLQHIPYSLQVKLKEDVLKDCLRRIGKIDTDISESLRGTAQWNYRLRGQFKVSGDEVGFYRENTRDIVDIESCPIINDDVNDHLDKARELLNADGIKELHITAGDRTAALLKVTKEFPHNVDLNSLASDFRNSGFPGLSIDTGENMVLNFGDPYISLALDGLDYSISPMSFIQGNWNMNLSIIKYLKEQLNDVKGNKILDLYSGAGNFSLPLAERFEVTGVEENPHAIEDGRRNLEMNGINNYQFIKSSAEDYKADEKFDVIILDPPRPGLTNEAMSNVLEMMPHDIVYISCNPTTFARDLKKLSSRYNIKSVRMADLFPQTFHIESLAFLSLD
jgi:23S rRNA (uracil1939-C5)-methyltransferase